MASNQRINYTLGFDADVRAAQQQIKNLVNSLKEIQSVEPIKYDDKDLKQAQKSAAQLANYIKEAYNVDTGKLDLSKFSQQLQKSNRTLKDFAVDFSKLGREGRQAFMELTASINAADAPMFKLSGRLQEFSRTLANTVKWQISSNITHGLESALSNAYHYAQDLNRSLTDIRIVTGYNTDAMADFAKEASKAASNLSVKTTDYTNAALIYYQQGLTESEVQERTNITMKMANVAGVAAETVSDQLTAIWNNFDNGSKSLEYYADVLTRLGADTASSTDEIVQGLQKFAAVSETIGLSYEYAAAAQATITDKTRESADVVGTALKTLFSRIQGLKLGETLEDGVDLNKYSAALDSVGISVLDQNNQLKDMDAILNELGAKWGMIGRSEQMALAQTVAGVRQYTQLIALMDNWDSFQLNVARAEGSEGSLDDQFEDFEEGWKAASAHLTQSIDNIYDSLINEEFFIKLDNFLTPIMNTIAGVIDGFGGFEGILLSVSSILMTTYAKDVPKVLGKISVAFSQLTKKGREQTIAMQQEAVRLAESRMFGDFSSLNDSQADVIQAKGLIKISQLKTELLNKQNELNDKEKAEFEWLIQSTEQSYKLIEAQVRRNEIKEENIAQELNSTLAEPSIDDFVTKLKETNEDALQQAIDEAKKSLAEIVDKYNADDRIKADKNRKNIKTKKGREQMRKSDSSFITGYLKQYEEQERALDKARQALEKYKKYANSTTGKLSEDFKTNLHNLRTYVTQNNIYSGLQEDSKEWSASLEKDMSATIATIKNQIDFVQNQNIFPEGQQKEYISAANKLKQILDNTELDTETKQAAIEEFRQTVAKLGQDVSFTDSKIEDIKNEIRELGAVLGIPEQNVEEFISSMEGLGTESAKTARNLDSVDKSLGKLPSHAASASEMFAGLSGMITGLVSIFKQFGSIIEGWDDMDTEERIGAIGGSIANIGTQALYTIPQLSNLAKSVGEAAVTGTGAGAKIAGMFGKIGGAIGKAGSAAKVAAAGFTAALGWIALIIAALGAMYAIYKHNQQVEQENYELAKKIADQKKEQLDLIQEEKKANADLLKSMSEQLKIYEETGENKSELDKATDNLCKAYDLEGAALVKLSGKYEDYNQLIKQATESSIKESEKAFEQAKEAQSARGEALMNKFLQIDVGDNGAISTFHGVDDIRYNEETKAGEILRNNIKKISQDRSLGIKTRWENNFDNILGVQVGIENIKSAEQIIGLYDALIASMQEYEEYADEYAKEKSDNEIDRSKIKNQFLQDSDLYKWQAKQVEALKVEAEAYKEAKKIVDDLQLENFKINIDGHEQNIQATLANITSYEEFRSVIEEVEKQLIEQEGLAESAEEAEAAVDALIKTSTNFNLSGFNEYNKALDDIIEQLKDVEGAEQKVLNWFNSLSEEEKKFIFEIDYDVITSTNNLELAMAAVQARYNANKAKSDYQTYKEFEKEFKDYKDGEALDLEEFASKYGSLLVGNVINPSSGSIIENETELFQLFGSGEYTVSEIIKGFFEDLSNVLSGRNWIYTTSVNTKTQKKSITSTIQETAQNRSEKISKLNSLGRGDWITEGVNEKGETVYSATELEDYNNRYLEASTIFKNLIGYQAKYRNAFNADMIKHSGLTDDQIKAYQAIYNKDITDKYTVDDRLKEVIEFTKSLEPKKLIHFLGYLATYGQQEKIVDDETVGHAYYDLLAYNLIDGIITDTTTINNADKQYANAEREQALASGQTFIDRNTTDNSTDTKTEEQDPYDPNYNPYADIYSDMVQSSEQAFQDTLDAELYNATEATNAYNQYINALTAQATAIGTDLTHWNNILTTTAGKVKLDLKNQDGTNKTSEQLMSETTTRLNGIEDQLATSGISEETRKSLEEEKKQLELILQALSEIVNLNNQTNENTKARTEAENALNERAAQAAKPGDKPDHREVSGVYERAIDKAEEEFKKSLENVEEYDKDKSDTLYTNLRSIIGQEQELLKADKAAYENELANLVLGTGLEGESSEKQAILAKAALTEEDAKWKAMTKDQQKVYQEEHDKIVQGWERILELINLVAEKEDAIIDYDNLLIDLKGEQKDLETEIFEKAEETLENAWEQLDIYAAINRELKLSDDLLKAINRKKNQSYGQNYLNALSEENNELNRQNQLLQKKAELAKQQAERETQNLIKQINVYNSTIAKENAALKLSSLMLDEQGNILNYQEILSQAQTYLHELEAQMLVEMSKEAWDAAAKLQTTINMVKDFISGMQASFNAVFDAQDYQIDAANQIADNTAQILANNFEKINYVLELRIKVNDNDLKLIEYQLEKIRDDIYSTVEVGQLLFNGDQSKLNNTLNALKQYETHYNNLESAMSQGLITEKDYYDGLQNTFDGLMDNLQALQDLDEEMRTFYADTLDKAMDEIGKYKDRLSDCTSVLEHYKNLVILVNGEEDFERIGTILEGQVKTLKNEMDMAVGVYEMLKKEQVAFQAMYDAASPDEQKWLQESLDAINEQVADAQDEMLSKTEEWAEAMKSVMENKMAQAAKVLEDTFSGGMGFDELNKSIDRLQTYQEDYLTKTNQIYEVEKLINQARRDADKTNNESAKTNINNYIKEMSKLKDKNQLSNLELEIAQAQYDILLAQIALEEAQNAKSTVRLQRDNEGNFGYVYTSDQEQVSAAEQELADAENALYNIGLEAANDYGQKRIELQQQLADELIALEERRAAGEFATEEEYNAAKDAIMSWYYKQMESYSNLYTIALGADNKLQEEAWITAYDNMVLSTDAWQQAVVTYTGNCEAAYDQYQISLSTNSEIIKTVLSDTAAAVKGVTDESEKLRDKGNQVTQQMGLELNAARNLTNQYMIMRPQIDLLAQSFMNLAIQIQSTLTAAAQFASIELEVPSVGGGTSTQGLTFDPNVDYTREMAKYIQAGGKVTDAEYIKLGQQRDMKAEATGWNKNPNYVSTDDMTQVYAGYGENRINSGYTDVIANGDANLYPDVVNVVINRDDISDTKAIHEIKKTDTYKGDSVGFGTFVDAVAGHVDSIPMNNGTRFNTGGYTGSWGPEGRVAILDEKELVLNKDDTSNFLLGINTLRNIVDIIDLSAMNTLMSAGLPSLSAAFGGSAQTLDQHVTIEASFPGVTNHSEIEEAFNNLINTASHYANRKLL